MSESQTNEKIVEVRFNRRAVLRGIAWIGLLLASLIAIMVAPDEDSLYAESLTGWAAFFSLLRAELGEVGAGHVLAGLFLAWLYSRWLLQPDGARPFCLSACIVGGVLAFFRVLGISFATFGNFDFICYRVAQVPIAAITFLGYWVVLYTLLKLLYVKLDEVAMRPRVKRVYVGMLKHLNDHFWLVCFVVLLVCWAVQMLPFFPGSVPHDGRNQLNQYFGYATMSTHHPVAATLIMGFVYDIGSSLFGTTGGCLFYVAFQSVLGAVVFCGVCAYIRRKTGRLWAGFVALAFYAFVPVFWTYAQTIEKDALYYIVFTWFALEYIKLLWGDSAKLGIVRLVVAAALMCAFRNEGCYIAIPALVVLVFILTDARILATVALALVVTWNFCWNTLFMSYMGWEPTNQVESISLPLQMLARYDLYYGDELTEEDREVINAVITAEGLGERYTPENADPVKNKGYRDTTDEEWEAFWDLWWELFTRHPLVYVEAALNEFFGYFDPFYFYSGLGQYQLYSKGSLSDADADVTYSTYAFSSDIRAGATDLAYSWNAIPLLSFLVNPAFYTWAGIILFAAMLRKRDFRNALVYVAPILAIAVCFASPVNGLVRYMLPVMAAMPLYVLVGLAPYWAGADAVSVRRRRGVSGGHARAAEAEPKAPPEPAAVATGSNVRASAHDEPSLTVADSARGKRKGAHCG